ncbi:MAG TPA: SCO family protein [Verrucomicrobiae bacterium]|jgi:protein SCO1/2|nr:SCO family protein [Verrucomicrobiae bacterium]
MFQRRLFFAVAFFVMVAASAWGQGVSAGTGLPGDTNRQVYEVKGVVKSLAADGKSVMVQHQAVTNYMPAMTMPFDVRDTNELRGLQAGDAIGFQLVVAGNVAWIEHVTKTGAAPPPGAEQPSRLSFRVVRDVDKLAIGDMLPEYHFTNELGQAISTKQFLGQAFAFTFFFTRCPYPTFCPLMSRNFQETEKKLLAMSGGPTNWHLFSISFDTEYDTPADLHDYAMLYQYQPAHWSFLTGDLTEITAIGDQVGEYFGHDESGGITHNLRTVVVDARGRIHQILPENKWTSDQLMAEIVAAAMVGK